jgi:predicted Fe-Mo cluster-binding NifX family protein
MKIAFSTSGQGLDALLDSRFGRCARFVVYDLELHSLVQVENSQNLQAAQGAGIQAAEIVLNAGADVLVSGHCGPKAFKVLRAGGVRVYNAQVLPLVRLLEMYNAGLLSEALVADVEGHW